MKKVVSIFMGTRIARLVVLGWLGLSGSSLLRAQMPDARLEKANDGLVSLIWETRAGSEYRVQSSQDLQNWTDEGVYYGTGATFSLPVARFDPAPAGNGVSPQPPPPSNTVSVYFVLSPFPAQGKTLACWRDDSGPVKALLDLDFGDIGSIPFLVTEFTDTSGQDYSLTLTSSPIPWNSSLSAFSGTSHLNAAQIVRRSILTDNFTAVHAAVTAAVASGGGSPNAAVPASSGGTGPRAWYRIVRQEPDSDGDGVPDFQEFLIGISAFFSDSDGDGWDDGTELTNGSNPFDPGSVPGVTPPAPQPGQYSDGDALEDAIDFDPLDSNIDWRKSAAPVFIALKIQESSAYNAVAVNNKGEVILQYDSATSSLPYYWKPGGSILAIRMDAEPLEFDVFNESTEEIETVDLLPVAARVHDINDGGVIIGDMTFTGIANTGSYQPGIISVDVATRWPAFDQAPERIHTGKEAGAAVDGGDIGLNSTATRINSGGHVVGQAEVIFQGAASDPVPTLWTANVTDSPGIPQYTPANPEPPRATISNLSDAEPDGIQYFGSSSAGLAAVWDAWGEEPDAVHPELGGIALEAALLPNDSRGILGSNRLLLKSPFGESVPAVRPMPGARHLTEQGTVFRDQNGTVDMWHAAMLHPVQAEVDGQIQSLNALSDVSSQGLVLGRFDPAGDIFLLLPVEILVLVVDENGDSTSQWISTNHLKVAKWEDSYVGQGQSTTVKPDFNEWDIDQFIIKIPMPWLAGQGSTSVKIGSTSDPDNLIHVTEVESGIFYSASQLLVSNDVDDEYPAGQDETLNDVTHKVALGDEVLVSVDLPGGGEARITAEVPARAELDLNVWRIAVPGVRTMDKVEEAVEWLKQAYAQVGLQINTTIEEQPWPTINFDPLGPGKLDIWDRDPDGTRHNFMPGYYEFINAFPDHTTTSVDLFFLLFAERAQKGYSVVQSDFHLNDNAVSARYLNHAFTSDSVSKNKVTPAHELLHVLTGGDGHAHTQEAFNLLSTAASSGWTFAEDDIRGRRRISRTQEDQIDEHPSLKEIE